ncbi:unnamed protein product, partial [Tetraodon nigroviridis]
LPGALHGARGRPEGYERQRGRLQVHHPCVGGGLHRCGVMGKGHGFAELRYDRRIPGPWVGGDLRLCPLLAVAANRPASPANTPAAF